MSTEQRQPHTFRCVLLVADRAPLQATLRELVDEARRAGVAVVMRDRWLSGASAIGAIGDADPLDSSHDPALDRGSLGARLVAAGVPASAAPHLVEAIAARDAVLDLTTPPLAQDGWRAPTLFEIGALADVIGDELAGRMPIDRVRIDRSPLPDGQRNHCELGRDGVARIRLLSTNGTTLAGRTHALVHELGHALLALLRFAGHPYAASYGTPDYGRFLDPRTFDEPCDEEALVRVIADAWLLRRRAVGWARTWPGAVDSAARDLDADALAAFARFRLAQGLGLAAKPVRVWPIMNGP